MVEVVNTSTIDLFLNFGEMMARITQKLILLMFFIFPNIAYGSERVLQIGVVPQFEQRKIKAIWQPILIEIYKQTGLTIELAGSKSIPEFEKQFSNGEFDFAYMNPYHLIQANRDQRYEPVLKDTSRMLSGILVVHKDSGIETLEQLSGKTIAFPSPNALGASLLPRANLSENYKINYQAVYVKNHGSVYLNVAMQIYPAGGGVLQTFNEQSTNVKNDLRIIYTTPEVPTHPIVVHPRVKKDTASKIINAIINLGNSVEGQELLSRIPIKKIGPAKYSEYEKLLTLGLERYIE